MKKDSIDWSHVSPDYRYMARDATGHTYVFRDKPEQKLGYWSSQERRVLAEAFVSYERGTVDWSESLIMRPE